MGDKMISNKKILLSSLMGFALVFTTLWGGEFENLPSDYCISFGSPEAPVKVIEYFSLSCPQCLNLLQKDFPSFRKKYVDTEQVFWVLHPDPADILTLQLMECLEKLSDKEKRAFFDWLLATLPKKPSKKIVFQMQQILEKWGRPLPYLHDLSFLERTEAFQIAFAYVKQPNAPKEIPTISVNGEIEEAFPNASFVEKEIEKALKNVTKPQQKGVI
jgi:hypothetical protein